MTEDADPGFCEGPQFTRAAYGQIMLGVDNLSLRACSNRQEEEEKTEDSMEEKGEARILLNAPGKSS
jgi:hypothetical protein